MYDLLIHDGVIWKQAKYIRESLNLPPLDPDEEKGLAIESQARQEAQSRVADARNSGQAAAMNDAQAERAVDLLTQALLPHSRIPAES